jgi:death on curing protein
VNILFLTPDDVLELHADQIAAFGGSPGVRDFGLLQSAIAIPQSGFGGTFAHEFPYGMAAAYLLHIAANHPFIDGNKRTGLAAALVFLEANGYTLAADHTAVGDMVLAVAAGTLDKAGVADFFKTHVRPV